MTKTKGYFPAPAGGDHCTREGAQALANKLAEWWHQRGYPMVQFWVEPVVVSEKARTSSGFNRNIVWGVRSNLVRGQPPRERKPDDAECSSLPVHMPALRDEQPFDR